MSKENGKVTIKSIAQELGVSFSTVAKALNNDPSISQQTRELVEKKAKEMNYTRNYFAQNLRQRSSKTVALILNDIAIPVYGTMAAIISRELAIRGYTTLIADPRYNQVTESNCIKNVLSRMPEAVIISPIHPDSENLKLLESVYSNTLVLGEVSSDIPVSSLDVGHRMAGYLAAKRMLQGENCNNLVLCGLQEFQSSQLFYAGIQDAYKEFNVPLLDSDVYWSKPSIRPTSNLFQLEWEKRDGNIDGVICVCDSMALGIYDAARKLGLHIPEDISVVGYDDSVSNEFLDPPLTSVHMPRNLAATHCSQFVLDRLLDGNTKQYTYRLEPFLADRESVADR